MAAAETAKPYVSSLVQHLQNKNFAAPCTRVEAIIDKFCAGNNESIVYQTETSLKMSWENLLRVDLSLLIAIREAIGNEYFRRMEVSRPCYSKYTLESYRPVTLVIMFKLPFAPESRIAADPDFVGGTEAPKLLVQNLRDLNIPVTMLPTVHRILNVLYMGKRGAIAPCPLKKVLYSAKTNTLVVEDPPTYSYEFISELVARFTGTIVDIVFEQKSDGGTITVTMLVCLRALTSKETDGYVREKGGARRGILSRFSPF